MNPVTPISITCFPAECPAHRKTLGLPDARQNGQRAGWAPPPAARRESPPPRRASTEISSCRARVFGARRPSGFSSRMRAKAPRGRITGSSNRPVAVPSRNSSRLATIRFTPRCCASGRITCSNPWLTSTTSAPGLHQLLHLLHASLFQARLQLVVKEFFARAGQGGRGSLRAGRYAPPGWRTCGSSNTETGAAAPSGRSARAAGSVRRTSGHSR